ncbi:HNH endonuclease [Geomonas silvestris]|uniref:HNH endonuclease n=1 Tax=Geomonas silvestris TaxID=2740184 RepID=UPI0035315FE1
MPFPNSVREESLVKSHRRCCVCHEFAGRSANVHHINQEADGGANVLENSIALCLRCHAEAGHYNPRHPMGTKYSPSELRLHRDQWWDHCPKTPEEPIGCGLEISYKRDPSSDGDLHTYWLLISFTNTSMTKQTGFTLDLFFPPKIPIIQTGSEQPVDFLEDGARCQKVVAKSDETIYRDQTIQLVGKDLRSVRYQMNHELYDEPRASTWRMLFNLYMGDLPVVREQRDWIDMHCF